MKKNINYMILNETDIGISKIELNKSDLLITDKTGKYCLKVCVEYNWKDINCIKPGTKEKVDFNEYYLSENNEAALIYPSSCYVKKINNDLMCFYLKFKDLSDTTHYMNKKGCFDIELNSLDVKVFIDYKDTKENSIIYNLK